MNLKPETIQKIDQLVPRYPTQRSAADQGEELAALYRQILKGA